MAMQAFNYGYGEGVPREGERRSEYDYASDERRDYVFANGAWRLERALTRWDIQNEQQFALNAYQQQAAALLDANPLYQGAIQGRFNGLTFTTTTPSPEAIARAEQLLLSHLSPEQIAQFKVAGWFEVVGGSTKRTYRIGKQSWPGKNVSWMDNGQARISYCAYPTGYAHLPVGDVMLAQKMALEDPEGEKRFTDMACWVDHMRGNQGSEDFVYGVRHGYMYINPRADGAAGAAAAADDEYRRGFLNWFGRY